MRSLLAGLLIREAVNLRKCRRSLFLNPLILNSPRKTERKVCKSFLSKKLNPR